MHADGVNAEQATAYQGFALDLVLPVVVCLTRLGREVPEPIAGPVGRMADFLGILATDAGTLPRIGDDDDAAGIDLASHEGRPERLRSRIRTTSLLLGRELSRVEPGLDEQTVWLCGDAADGAPSQGRLPGSAAFPDGGYAVLRRRGRAGEVRAVLKAGPFGLGPLFAHGHADLLSVCVAIDGEEAVIDPGTFTYYGDARWRDHGRSTEAHSTLRVGGRDQADPIGPFMWRRPPRANLGAVRLDGDRLLAEGHHDAYAPVRHSRRVELHADEIAVTDRLTGPADHHHVELRWQLAPGRIAPTESGWIWSGERVGVEVEIEGLGAARAIVGCESRPAGFASRALEHREPAPVIVAHGRVSLPAVIVSHIRPAPRGEP